MSEVTSICPFKKKAIHNEAFHKTTCEQCPTDFYDWKITTLFYSAIHYVKSLANQKGIDIGNDHWSIRNNIKPPDNRGNKPLMAFSKNAYGFYDYLYQSSQNARYSGFVDNSGAFTDETTYESIMQADHDKCQEALEKLKNYLVSIQGLK